MSTHAQTPVNCRHCGTEMEYKKVTRKNMQLQALGLLLAIIAIGIMIMGGVPGIVVGLIVLVIASRLGYSRKRGWICGHCGDFFEPAA